MHCSVSVLPESHQVQLPTTTTVLHWYSQYGRTSVSTEQEESPPTINNAGSLAEAAPEPWRTRNRRQLVGRFCTRTLVCAFHPSGLACSSALKAASSSSLMSSSLHSGPLPFTRPCPSPLLRPRANHVIHVRCAVVCLPLLWLPLPVSQP